VSVRILYVFSVAIDVFMKSAETESNSVDEKFGNPQIQQKNWQIHETCERLGLLSAKLLN